MLRVADHIKRLQGNSLTVLITGESGTGKELVARAVHAGSPRRSAMFLPYNCTTTTRDLADSQLFGHRRGSFTGAVDRSAGPHPLGGRRHAVPRRDRRPADRRPAEAASVPRAGRDHAASARRVRSRWTSACIAATNADLEQRVGEGRFREDLYYRLSVMRIRVPPLRERREEIPHLAMLLPPGSVRAPGQARRRTGPGGAPAVRRVPVARQRPPAAERDPACRRPELAGHGHQPRAAVAGAVAARRRRPDDGPAVSVASADRLLPRRSPPPSKPSSGS